MTDRASGGDAELPSKVPHIGVVTGDTFLCEGPAGVGYGAPLERDPEAVRADVLDGFISAVTSERDYGVVLTPAGEVDGAGAAALRRLGCEAGP